MSFPTLNFSPDFAEAGNAENVNDYEKERKEESD